MILDFKFPNDLDSMNILKKIIIQLTFQSNSMSKKPDFQEMSELHRSYYFEMDAQAQITWRKESSPHCQELNKQC